MSTMPSKIRGSGKPTETLAIILSFAGLAILYHVGQAIYNAFFGPLSKFPGPPLRALSKIPLIKTMVTGTDNIDYPGQYSPRSLSSFQ